MATGTTVLVIENDESTLRVLQDTLRQRYKVLTASCWAQAHEIRTRAVVDAVVVGVTVGSGGQSGLDDLCAEAASTPLVCVAAGPREARRHRSGEARSSLVAFETRPTPLPELSRAVDDVIAGRQPIRGRPQPGEQSSQILADSHPMRAVMELIDRAALRDTSVLLVGESGTGKELLARALHDRGPRADGPFVAVNCSAIPETLLESELFGYRKGAFTDARDDQRGLFPSAQHGTIFLDEIGDMAPALQGKLLRVLQEKEVHPLGASVPVPTDVRVVAATHRDVSTLVAEGRFREDLLYRINVIEVRVPPLRDRPDDIEPLIRHLLSKHGAALGRPGCSVSPGALAVLRSHRWPGNVRELENVIERALVLGTGTVLTVGDLPENLREPPSTAGRGGGRRLAEVVREHIVRTLRDVAGNKAAAARVLGLDRKTLYRKLVQHRIATRQEP